MSLLKTLTEGGQIWAHRIRMIRQVLKIALYLSLFVSGTIFFTRVAQIDQHLYQGAIYYYKSLLFRNISPKAKVDSAYWDNNGQKGNRVYHINHKEVLKRAEKTKSEWQRQIYRHVRQAAIYAGLIFVLCNLFFLLRGVNSKKKKHLRGQKVIGPRQMALKLRLKRDASPIKIGIVPMRKGTEVQHTLISGGTGSGKTNCYHHILPQIRHLGQRAVVVDTTGEFVAKYYNPKSDIILNPFDARSAKWHPWEECRDIYDYDALAQSFIPLSFNESESYWRNAARAVFSSMLELQKEEKLISEMCRLLLFEPLRQLSSVVEGTKAAAHLDPSSDKTASSVRSVMTTFLEPLTFLEDTSSPFSIRQWVQEGRGEGWIFLTSTIAQRTTLVPLISAWFSIAMRSLLQMEINPNRRLWFIADELPSLNRLKDLETCLAESRKFGGAALLAIQSPAQLEIIYGREGAKVIVGNCATRIAFSEQDPEIAHKISKVFGEREVQEFQEGISYGAHQMRDGVSFSSQNKVRPLVYSTDIQSLERNQAFIKLPGDLPVTKVKLQYNSTRKTKTETR